MKVDLQSYVTRKCLVTPIPRFQLVVRQFGKGEEQVSAQVDVNVFRKVLERTSVLRPVGEVASSQKF